jgi:uncharacterized protein YcsI (UPF0317 family)
MSTTSLSNHDEKNICMDMLREALPACQPQEGSPANTFTESEKEQLQSIFPNMNLGARNNQDQNNQNRIDICDWSQQEETNNKKPKYKKHDTQSIHENAQEAVWHGAPRMDKADVPRAFRQAVRNGTFQSPTNGVCPGFLQCNLVVLPQGPQAFDFLLFCQRNPKACPLIEVCDVGSPFPNGVAKGADLRTDVPMYAIYRDGKLVEEVSDVTDHWPENSVAFLIGCSFSYDGALLDAHIPLRSADDGKNVPMYRTNLKCRPAGSLCGNTVVSMKPIKATDVAKEVEITSQYPHAHGGPVCVGNAKAIGIQDIDKPDWGDAIELRPDEVPVFHACGVTPQSVLMDSKVPFAITHKAGYMFVTDLPADSPP